MLACWCNGTGKERNLDSGFVLFEDLGYQYVNV